MTQFLRLISSLAFAIAIAAVSLLLGVTVASPAVARTSPGGAKPAGRTITCGPLEQGNRFPPYDGDNDLDDYYCMGNCADGTQTDCHPVYDKVILTLIVCPDC